MDHKWQAVYDEIAHWAAEGRVARFWLRDDDAIEPTVKLDDFLSLTARFQVPVLLAVIPEPVKATLADRLAKSTHVRPAVHGWSHTNHAPENEKSQELGPHRSQDIVLAELGEGLNKLSNLFGETLLPILVPPWNRFDQDLLPQLSDLGYRAISAFGRKPFSSRIENLKVINTHIDMIDWKGTRGCRNHDDLIVEIAKELESSRLNDDAAIGILTHHLVHDDAVRDFLKKLFGFIESHPSATWVKAADSIQ